mmetsp:Transcript_29002/g.43011  ORF Transcript_29002/g.43011 Transcript_29002/m.43011 type:complete len:205 (+) Transcript_29002:639-1253(+)
MRNNGFRDTKSVLVCFSIIPHNRPKWFACFMILRLGHKFRTGQNVKVDALGKDVGASGEQKGVFHYIIIIMNINVWHVVFTRFIFETAQVDATIHHFSFVGVEFLFASERKEDTTFFQVFQVGGIRVKVLVIFENETGGVFVPILSRCFMLRKAFGRDCGDGWTRILRSRLVFFRFASLASSSFSGRCVVGFVHIRLSIFGAIR